jgi:hypothetical protein
MTFHRQATQGNFSGLAFAIGASSVKWSLNLTSATTNSTSSPGSSGFTIRYQLSQFSSSLNSSSSSEGTIKEVRNHPQANMTTFFLSLTAASVAGSISTVVAEVQVFDVALIDGSLVPINHSVIFTNATPTGGGGGSYYELVLTFPPFEQSLFYDPSLGLGVLLGSDAGGGGSDNTALVVAVAVVVPVAVIAVAGVVVGGAIVMWVKKKRSTASLAMVNFTSDNTELL